MYMFILKKRYFVIIESIKEINLKKIKNFNKLSIIYRNKNPEQFDKLQAFRLSCKKKGIRFFISNSIKLMFSLKADGIYISAHNKNLSIPSDIHKKFEIIGAAHNIKEINLKKRQNCSQILVSRLFETSYENKTGFLGIVRFNLLQIFSRKKLIPLGGINLLNYKKVKMINSEGIAVSSFIKKNPEIYLKILV